VARRIPVLEMEPTVYRRVESRDRLVHAALAREFRRFFLAVADEVAGIEPVADRVVEGVLVGLTLAPTSVVVRLGTATRRRSCPSSPPTPGRSSLRPESASSLWP